MNFFKDFRNVLVSELQEMARAGLLPADADFSRITVEPPRDETHGDLATNAAMVLAKPAGLKPRDLATRLGDRLAQHPDIISVDVAGPGFLNLRLKDAFWQSQLATVLQKGTRYGDTDLGGAVSVNVEYVSANPTGPLHVGHCRGAVVGDALANLLEKAGYSVTREYYINDAGAQVDSLARSLRLRYLVAIGDMRDETFEEVRAAGGIEYGGDYLKEVAAALVHRDRDKWRTSDEDEWFPVFRTFATDTLMEVIREDLAQLGVVHDLFSSERALVDSGRVDTALDYLRDNDLIYHGILEPPKGKKLEDWEAREQTLFKATQFGDDVDRPVQKSDGAWTYFATDMAYHRDKFTRGFSAMIDVWGADHGGYVKRMKAAVSALTDGKGALDVKLCQMVNLLDGGTPVKMSKRAGTFITLREVIDRVGRDVVRFIMLTRKNDAQLDFDFQKVTEQSKDNPVFYVQYAHARGASVLRHAAEAFAAIDQAPEALAGAKLETLGDPAELALIKFMAQWPRTVESAAESHEPHRIAYYLYDLASLFHALWNRGKDDTTLRFLVDEDPELTRARLALVRGVMLVIASGLAVIGVEPVEEMR
ncbi:MAG: arginine--tRNA ligase [Magnetospiraceae bacterium]